VEGGGVQGIREYMGGCRRGGGVQGVEEQVVIGCRGERLASYTGLLPPSICCLQ